jgi:hypothetical protein
MTNSFFFLKVRLLRLVETVDNGVTTLCNRLSVVCLACLALYAFLAFRRRSARKSG